MKKRRSAALPLFLLLLAVRSLPAVAQVEVNGHKYVDLGLPSGTLWAECNVGAASPTDYGDYFAWGETAPSSVYSADTYKWLSGGKLIKYCNKSQFGNPDGRTTLEPADDAATANRGAPSRMPTKEEFEELLANCDMGIAWPWPDGTICGYEAKSKRNGRSIFFPAAGSKKPNLGSSENIKGFYWTASLYESYCTQAETFFFDRVTSNYKTSFYLRSKGCSVRPVIKLSATLHSAAHSHDHYATCYFPVPVTVPAKVTAFAVSLAPGGNGVLELSAYANVIPANTAVLLVGGGQGEAVFKPYEGDASRYEVEGNLLKGVLADEPLADPQSVYVLSELDGVVGFYHPKDNRLLAGKAYLPASVLGTLAAVTGFPLPALPVTGVKSALSGNPASGGLPVYDLAGRRVAKPQPGGLYLRGGRKFIAR